MDVVVFGAGSLGSLVGGLLASEHDVTLVGRSPHVEAVRASGLQLTGLVDETVHPDAVTELEPGRNEPADLAVVTVKAYDTDSAAEALSRCDLGVALSLSNGMGNEETLSSRLSCPVLAGTTSYAARLREPGVVECTGVGEVTIGPRPEAESDGDLATARDVAQAFRKSGIGTLVADNMRFGLWEKLAVNAAINPITALAGVENGALLDEPGRPIAERAATEVAGVARSEGVRIADETAIETLHRVTGGTAGNRSSMLEDVAAGRRTEIDAICGYVVDRAEAPVPVNETLAALVRTWEAARGLRDSGV